MLSMISGILTGICAGVVLYKVGATRYSRIMGMLTLRDTKVMKFTFMSIAVASMIYGLAAVFGIAESWSLVPRVMPYLGTAHIVGGVLFGLGLGVTGLCPGTCMAKTGGRGGDKKFVGLAASTGLVVGILIYAEVKEPLTQAGIIAAYAKPLTLHGALGLPYGALAVVFGVLLLGIAIAVDRLTPERAPAMASSKRGLATLVRGEWSWVASGTAFGLLVVIATMQAGYLGFSGSVLAAVGWSAELVGHPLDVVPVINADIQWRAALLIGLLPGGLLAKTFSLRTTEEAAPTGKVWDPRAVARAFTAGIALSLGAMIGGGCTTGAYISAWPTLSLGSFAMGGTFFAVSMAVANVRLLARMFDLRQAQTLGDRVYD